MQVELTEFDDHINASELKCPQCGETDIHHDRVEVFERQEDETSGVHVAIEEGKAVIDSTLKGNPSARRHGLCVRFWCEHCKGKSTLTLAQHKGKTYVAWRLEK